MGAGLEIETGVRIFLLRLSKALEAYVITLLRRNIRISMHPSDNLT